MFEFDGLTLKDVEKMHQQMKDKSVMPKKVKSKKEAKKLSRHDPLGRTWKKGDEYYLAMSSEYAFPV